MSTFDMYKNLRKFREQRNISQFQLELIADIAHGTISRIEKGLTNPTKETLLKISKVLELTTEEYLILVGIESRRSYPFENLRILDKKIKDIMKIEDNVQYSLGYGKDLFIEACDSTLYYDADEILFVLNTEMWRKIYTEDYGNSYYIPKRIEQKKFARFILNPSMSSQLFRQADSKSFRSSKINTTMQQESESFAILDDRVFVFFSDSNAQVQVIKNERLAEGARNLFNSKWKLL